MILRYLIKPHGIKNTRTMMIVNCDWCDSIFMRRKKYYDEMKKNRLYDEKELCKECCRNYLSKKHIGECYKHFLICSNCEKNFSIEERSKRKRETYDFYDGRPYCKECWHVIFQKNRTRKTKKSRIMQLLVCHRCGNNYNIKNTTIKNRKTNSFYDGNDYCGVCWRKRIFKKRPTRTSKKTIHNLKCYECGSDFIIKEQALKNRKKSVYFDSNNYCKTCWIYKTCFSDSVIEKRKKTYQKTLEKRSDETRKKISEFSRKRMMGDKNPMKRKDVAKKVSDARKKMFKENPEMRIRLAESSKKAWVDGKFEGVRVGQCKWYDYKHSNGKVYKVQGTWELAFIKWLDESNMKFICHRGWIPYILNEEDHNYYPDFWVNIWDSYVDVKCKHFYNAEKFNAIRESNPEMNLKILYKKDLQELGVGIK